MRDFLVAVITYSDGRTQAKLRQWSVIPRARTTKAIAAVATVVLSGEHTELGLAPEAVRLLGPCWRCFAHTGYAVDVFGHLQAPNLTPKH